MIRRDPARGTNIGGYHDVVISGLEGSSGVRAKRTAVAHIQLVRPRPWKRMIMSNLLQELHGLVPSLANDFLWADERGELEAFCCESLDTVSLAQSHIGPVAGCAGS
jgi:hypothetical protein